MKKVILFLAAFALGVLVFGPGLLFLGCSGEDIGEGSDGTPQDTQAPTDETLSPEEVPTGESVEPCVTHPPFELCSPALVYSGGVLSLTGDLRVLEVSTDRPCVWFGTVIQPRMDFQCSGNLVYGQVYQWVLPSSMGMWYPDVWDDTESDLVWSLCAANDDGGDCG